jgi:hypothetical protein
MVNKDIGKINVENKEQGKTDATIRLPTRRNESWKGKY